MHDPVSIFILDNECIDFTGDGFGLLHDHVLEDSWLGPYGYGGDYGYQGDVDTGWRLLGHRYYDSDTGRFLTRDPAKDGRNWYSYCANNPINNADPSGLKPGDPFNSIEEAMADAGRMFGKRSNDENLEYFGYVIRNDDGTYTYTAEPGDPASGTLPPTPANAVAVWHSHPGRLL